PDQSGTGGSSNGIHILNPDASLVHRLGDNMVQPFHMRSCRQFRHDATKGRMFVELAAHDIGTNCPPSRFIPYNNGCGGFVAAGFNAQYDGLRLPGHDELVYSKTRHYRLHQDCQNMQSPAPFARIGTRGSPLALAQAKLVRSLIAGAHGVGEDDIAIEIFSTGGDRSQSENTTLSDIGGKGVFTKEIDDALLSGRIDIGVHSSKDVATGLPQGMVLAAFLEREDVRDAFLSINAKD